MYLNTNPITDIRLVKKPKSAFPVKARPLTTLTHRATRTCNTNILINVYSRKWQNKHAKIDNRE